MGITSLWEDLEAKLLTPGQLLGYPWKVWGITVQTRYVEGWWHQNWVRSRPKKILPKRNRKSWEMEIFYSSASSSKTKRDIAMGHKRPLWKTALHRTQLSGTVVTLSYGEQMTNMRYVLTSCTSNMSTNGTWDFLISTVLSYYTEGHLPQ